MPSIWPCTRWGLPCRLACARRGGLLPRLFTLTPAEAVAVYFLWHFPSTHPHEWTARVYLQRNRSYAASCPAVFGLSSPVKNESDPPPFQGGKRINGLGRLGKKNERPLAELIFLDSQIHVTRVINNTAAVGTVIHFLTALEVSHVGGGKFHMAPPASAVLHADDDVGATFLQ